MEKMIVLKLGGSVITDKEKEFTVSDSLRRIAREIKKARSELIIVHGGGSFGHAVASKYKIHLGARKEINNQLLGFCLTQKAMQDLNNKVIAALLSEGIPAFTVQPFITMNGKVIEEFPVDGIKNALDLKIIPVLYGAPVADKKQRFAILSGDDIVSYLAEKFRPEKVILAVDVDGVYDKDPKTNPDAKLIRILTEKKYRGLMFPKTSTDVTGGMDKKLKEALKLSKLGIESQIINAKKPGNLAKSLRGERIGTTIK